MSRKITQYAQEFKKSSAELAVSSAKSLSETARDLGIKPSTLYQVQT
jgi:transposase-like protein